MTAALLSYLMLLPAQVLCLLPMCHQLKPGRRKALIFLVVLDAVLFPLAALVTVRCELDINYVLFPLLLVFFAVYQWIIRCPVSKSLSVFMSVSALMAILCNLTCAIEASIDPSSGASVLTLRSALLQLGVNTAAAGLLAFPFYRYGSRLIDQLKLQKIWYMTLPFSAVLIICNLFIRPLKYETLFVNNVFRSFLFSIFSFLILWNLLCVIYYQIVMGVLHAARTREKMRILEMQESQFESQQQYMESFARTRHDFRQNIRTMKNLFHEGDYEQLGKYIDEYYDSLPVPETRRYCSNTALNALLNYYAGKAKENDIPLSFRIDIPQKISVSDVDLCQPAPFRPGAEQPPLHRGDQQLQRPGPGTERQVPVPPPQRQRHRPEVHPDLRREIPRQSGIFPQRPGIPQRRHAASPASVTITFAAGRRIYHRDISQMAA